MSISLSHRFGRIASLLTAGLLALSLLTLPALAAPNLPKPTDIFYVGDFANVLENDTVETIAQQNQLLREQSGAEIVVVTVDFLDGYEIEDYAYALFNSWGIGSAEKNNGVLLLLAIGEENYWCVQGRGLEKSLPSSTIGSILQEYLEPDFAAGEYDSGVRKTFSALYDTVSKQYSSGNAPTTVPPTPVSNSSTKMYLILNLLAVAIALAIPLGILFGWVRIFGRRRTVVYTPPINRRHYRTTPYGRMWRSPRPVVPPPPRPRPPRPPRPTAPTGSWQNPSPRPPMGGSTRGGGAGRSSSSGRSSFGGSSRSFSGRSSSSGRSSFGGGRSGGGRSGGGSTRGGGAGRGR